MPRTKEEISAYNKAYYLKHPELSIARRRAYYAANKERIALQKHNKLKTDFAANPRLYKDKALWKRYGVTEPEFHAMWKAQDGKCPLCDCELQPGMATHVDHDHATGRVRSLLCRRCNVGLGHFEKRPGWLDRALAYLKHHKEAA